MTLVYSSFLIFCKEKYSSWNNWKKFLFQLFLQTVFVLVSVSIVSSSSSYSISSNLNKNVCLLPTYHSINIFFSFFFLLSHSIVLCWNCSVLNLICSPDWHQYQSHSVCKKLVLKCWCIPLCPTPEGFLNLSEICSIYLFYHKHHKCISLIL